MEAAMKLSRSFVNSDSRIVSVVILTSLSLVAACDSNASLSTDAGTDAPVTPSDDGGTADGAPSTGTADGGDAPCALPSFIATESQPIGWATQNGGTTGGAGAAPTLVTTLDEFNA